MKKSELKALLEKYYKKYNQPDFIKDDPISIPKMYTQKGDIEIMGFLISMISWGQRISIIRSGHRLNELFAHEPYNSIMASSQNEMKELGDFVHRTFNSSDLASMIWFLRWLYEDHGGLENAIYSGIKKGEEGMKSGLEHLFQLYESSPAYLKRTCKHLPNPQSGSACKRLNMYLRWMVRKDDSGVDFGIWTQIKSSDLICPLDVHVIRQSIKLGLLQNDKSNWKNAVILTEKLKEFDSNDPVRFDYSLFGMGIEEKNSLS